MLDYKNLLGLTVDVKFNENKENKITIKLVFIIIIISFHIVYILT